MSIRSLLCISFLLLSGASVTFSADGFVRVKDGKIYAGNKRIKSWGVNLNCDRLKSHKQVRAIAKRIKAMGFNAVRFWPNSDNMYAKDATTVRKFKKYKKGDCSRFDLYDYMIYCLKKEGIWVRLPVIECLPKKHFGVNDYNVIPVKPGEKNQKNAWIKGIRQSSRHVSHLWYVDERCQALMKEHISNWLNHVNPYTGIRNAEEPILALYELHNEDDFASTFFWWYSAWSPYFRNKFQQKWKAFLKKKYGSASKYVFMPKKGKSAKEAWRRFIYKLMGDYNSSMIKHIRTHAPKGVGCNVVPVTVDTIGRQSLRTFYPSMVGDYVSVSMYVNGTTANKKDPYYPWMMYVSKPPSFTNTNGVGPDGIQLKDKPHILYETNELKPARYRAEYPMRMAVYGSWQDWDGVFFYIFINKTPEEGMIYKNEDFPTHMLGVSHAKSAWYGSHLATDEVMLSQFKAAGALFLNKYIKPAKNPTIFTFGKKAIFGKKSEKYLNGRITQRGQHLPPVHP